MQAIKSDTQIRADLRAVLTRHRLDLIRTSFSCSRGVVRLQGELSRRNRAVEGPLDLNDLELLEHELAGVKGVVRVHFDLANWRRLSTGEWQPVRVRERAPLARVSGPTVAAATC